MLKPSKIKLAWALSVHTSIIKFICPISMFQKFWKIRLLQEVLCSRWRVWPQCCVDLPALVSFTEVTTTPDYRMHPLFPSFTVGLSLKSWFDYSRKKSPGLILQALNSQTSWLILLFLGFMKITRLRAPKLLSSCNRVPVIRILAS